MSDILSISIYFFFIYFVSCVFVEIFAFAAEVADGHGAGNPE